MYVIELTCFDVDAKQTTVTHAISKFKNLRADAAWIHWPKRTDGTFFFFFHDQNGRPYFSTSGISLFIHRFSALKYKHQFKNQLSPAKLETFQCEHKYRISARQLISLPHLFFFFSFEIWQLRYPLIYERTSQTFFFFLHRHRIYLKRTVENWENETFECSFPFFIVNARAPSTNRLFTTNTRKALVFCRSRASTTKHRYNLKTSSLLIHSNEWNNINISIS